MYKALRKCERCNHGHNSAMVSDSLVSSETKKWDSLINFILVQVPVLHRRVLMNCALAKSFIVWSVIQVPVLHRRIHMNSILAKSFIIWSICLSNRGKIASVLKKNQFIRVQESMTDKNIWDKWWFKLLTDKG